MSDHTNNTTLRDNFASSHGASVFAKWKLDNITVGELQETYGDSDEPLAAAYAAFCLQYADAMLKARQSK